MLAITGADTTVPNVKYVVQMLYQTARAQVKGSSILLNADAMPVIMEMVLSVSPANYVVYMLKQLMSAVAQEIRIQCPAVAKQDITEMAYTASHAAFAIQMPS
jgi:hypothetical protein